MSPESGSRTADQALDAYAAQAAHQLGEAVALMRASTTVLERQGPGSADARDALRGMLAGIERAQRFVDDLLELTAVGRAEPLVEPVDVAAVLDEVRRDLAEPIARARATVSGDPATITADRRHVRRLLMHLTRTALASGATSVDVSAGAGDGGDAVIEVRDDGLPPDAEAGDPFAPFARARGRGPLVGAGVSLALCRRIAEAHGGAIALEPRDGGGVVVAVTLPPRP